MGVVSCTWEWVSDDSDDWCRGSLRMAEAVGTAPRNSPLATSARPHRPRLFDTPVVAAVVSPPSE